MLSIKDSLIKYVFEPNKKVNTFWASSSGHKFKVPEFHILSAHNLRHDLHWCS
jgi:hypothetical protein